MNDNTVEIWKVIPGYQGNYEVSSFGRVRSWMKRGRGSGNTAVEPRIMTPAFKGGISGRTYAFVTLYRENCTSDQRYVHHLVAEAFVGPRPAGMQVAHNDGNPKNNRADNVRYATPLSNNADKKKHGTQVAGEKHPKAKLNDQIVAEIRSLAGSMKQKDLAERFGVTSTTIGNVINNKTWKAA